MSSVVCKIMSSTGVSAGAIEKLHDIVLGVHDVNWSDLGSARFGKLLRNLSSAEKIACGG